MIDKIEIQNDGYIWCRSSFYQAQSVISNVEPSYLFKQGINMMVGEIDFGAWAVSYLLSMYTSRAKDFILFEPARVTVNDEIISLDEFSVFSCYMDKSYPLFSTDDTVKNLIISGLKKSKLKYTADEIKNIFCIDPERFERPITGVGNELFKCMAAIGYSNGKQVFCFPWLSKQRFDSYHANLTYTLEILAKLDNVVIVPVGK